MLLLFDEPGLNLHAMAQRDLLRFIDERLAPEHQVIYTTHSPFMINLNRLNSIRTVQDMDDRGTVVSDDLMIHDTEAMFPLQVAMGYRLAESLFLAPYCLLLNSPSDQIYLRVLGEAVVAHGRQPLDSRWVTIPVGGADNIPTYLSLLSDRNISVTISSPIKIRDGDFEDLFDPYFYLRLVNQAYRNELPRDLTMNAMCGQSPRIAHRIQRFFEKENICGGHFDKYRPAAYLLRHIELRSQIDEATIARAASMFKRVNHQLLVNGKSNGVVHYVNGADDVASGHRRVEPTAGSRQPAALRA
jgi:hypothetical protein